MVIAVASRITERIGPTRNGYIGEQGSVTGYGKDRPVLHACERCGYVRRVKYTPRLREGVEVGGSVSATCTACDYEINAAKYERLAALNRSRAAKARAAQAMQRLKPLKSKGA